MVAGSKEQVQEDKTRFDKDIDSILQQNKQAGHKKLRKSKSVAGDDNKK